MSPKTSGGAGGVATQETPDTRPRELRHTVKGKLPAFTSGSFSVSFGLIGIAGVAS
jgi:hypothetical protein